LRDQIVLHLKFKELNANILWYYYITKNSMLKILVLKMIKF